VEIRGPAGEQRVLARREVILCGGVVNSPQLLLLSGIGPRAELAKHGIELRHELPGVGQSLQDHLGITVITADQTRTGFGVGLKTLPQLVSAFFEYRRHGTGLFSATTEAGGFARLTPESVRPEIQFHFMPGNFRDHGRKLTLGYGLTLHCSQLRPKSRGYVGLRSRDPYADPVIEPRYLSHDDDLAEMLQGYKLGRAIMGSAAMRAITGGVEIEPGAGATTDSQLVDSIRNRAESVYHPVGTCRMGTDPLAVVDPFLRVYGVTHLRVADASIMPRLTGGNTHAPAAVIGANAARILLEQQALPPQELTAA
jgi:choline dehydrogenase-like flavoprotein